MSIWEYFHSYTASGRVGMRRVGEEEGVRRSLGNIQQQQATSSDLAALSKRVVVRPVHPAVLRYVFHLLLFLSKPLMCLEQVRTA